MLSAAQNFAETNVNALQQMLVKDGVDFDIQADTQDDTQDE